MKSTNGLLISLAALASSAAAGVTGSFQSVASESGSAPPAGFVTQDLLADASTDWLAANLIIDLTSGSILQDPILVGIGPPSPALISAIPALRWDTYLTGSAGIAGGAPSSAGGAVDLGGTAAGSFNASHIDINWFTVSTNDIGQFTLGRFTLSDTAQGYFTLRLDALSDTAARSEPFYLQGTIQNGAFVAVPEHGSAILSAMAIFGCGMIIIRRRLAASC